jgi:hypothetical protein
MVTVVHVLFTCAFWFWQHARKWIEPSVRSAVDMAHGTGAEAWHKL